MTEERYRALEYGESVLTCEELNQGWHFCPDWDFMLIRDGEVAGVHVSEPCSCAPYRGKTS